MKALFIKSRLRGELLSAGADKAEIDQLTAIAADLRNLKTSTAPNRRLSLAPFALAGFAGILIGALLVTLSQTSLPNSLLYPVKKTSEHIAVAVDPDYRGVVMMRRAQEVRKLVAARASTKTVLATLADYKSEAMAYKTNSANYSVFEFCKTNLLQAESGASGSENQAIKNTLSSLQNV